VPAPRLLRVICVVFECLTPSGPVTVLVTEQVECGFVRIMSLILTLPFFSIVFGWTTTRKEFEEALTVAAGGTRATSKIKAISATPAIGTILTVVFLVSDIALNTLRMAVRVLISLPILSEGSRISFISTGDISCHKLCCSTRNHTFWYYCSLN
jgi:uncharacterized membrane protein